MQTVACPSCGAELSFRMKASLFCVCKSCGTAVVRKDIDIQAIGKMAELPPDSSVVQIGTKGTFETKSFEVLGRLVLAYDQGRWNEWYLTFGSGREGWLAEAQGEFMICFAMPVDTQKAQAAKGLKAGTKLELGEAGSWIVGDVREVTVVASEGELPFAAAAGRKGLSIDLGMKGSSLKFATLELPTQGEPRFFAGSYANFAELGLTNIRRFEGWEY